MERTEHAGGEGRNLIITLRASEIVLDVDWNSRQEYRESRAADAPDQSLSFDQLCATIAEHGILQPPCVRRLEDRRWGCVYGFRRILAQQKLDSDNGTDTEIDCLVLMTTGDSDADDEAARVANLTENLHRESLKPWEIADALYRLSHAHPDLTRGEIAAKIGLTESYVSNLIRLRAQAHPKVWRQFKRWGARLKIPYGEVLSIVALPRDEQVEAWNAYLDSHKSRGKRGKEKKPGPAKLRKYKAAVDSIRKSPEFRRGLKLGLAIALGEKPWTFT